jgi:hypothetical protein
MGLRRILRHLTERYPAARRLRKQRRRADYLVWLASSEGPREAYFLKRFTPSWRVLYLLRLRHAFSKARPHCRDARDFFIPPSPAVKVRALRRYANAFDLATFVETGTLAGATVATVADLFDRCFTIELSRELWERASAALANKENVSCLWGDSAVVLPEVLLQIEGPALFWLDAHASGGDTTHSGRDPIFDELSAIYAHPVKRHVVLIDDARGHDIEAILASVPPTHRAVVRNDIIRITPVTKAGVMNTQPK